MVRVQSRRFEAMVGDAEIELVVPKKLRFRQPDFVDPIAVGDRVTLTLSDGKGIVDKVLPRENLLSRPASGRKGKRQLLAANLDLAVVVMAAAEPVWKTTTIDRYLIMASAAGIRALICMNKVDLDSDVSGRQEFSPYKTLEIPLVWVSAKTGFGVKTLGEQLVGKNAFLIGPSGAGKSSLINRLIPKAQLPVGKISERTQKGRHTTTWVEMRFLSGGGSIVDSPGLRVLDLSGIESEDLGEHFPEIKALSGACRFHDCRHISEPDCGVKEGTRKGQFAPKRYDSYRRIYESLMRGDG